MDFYQVTTREIETAIFAVISATAYQGLNRHKPSNSATAYVSTLEDAFQLTKLLTVQHQGNRAVQVQAYLASGPNVHRCVVRGVVPDHPDQDILPDLRTPSHRILAARRLGKGDTYLLTVQGEQQIPEIIYHLGAILRPREYKPSTVICYRCCQPGHMKAFCPVQTVNPELVNADGSARYQCGLCRTNDHSIASPKCPRKKKLADVKSRKTDKPAPHTGKASILTKNRFQALAEEGEEEESDHTVSSNDGLEALQPSYAAIVKATRKLQQPPRKTATSQHSSQDLHGASQESSSCHQPRGAKNMPSRTPRRGQEARSPSAAENVNIDDVTGHLLSVAKALDTLTSQIAAMQSSLDAVLMILQRWMSRQ